MELNKKGQINWILVIGVAAVLIAGIAMLAVFLKSDAEVTSTAAVDEVPEQAVVAEGHSAGVQSLRESLGPLTEQERNRRLLREKILIDNFIKANNLDSEEFYAIMNKAGSEFVAKISRELEISQEEAAYLINVLNEQRRNYHTLKDEDAFEIVKIDFMTFDERVENQVELPQAFMEDPPQSLNQVAIVIPRPGSSFNELLEEVSGEELSSEAKNEDVDINELIRNVTDKALGTNALELEKSFCLIGSRRDILLRADDLISNQGVIDYTYDQIVYGPSGKIIPELSRENKAGQKINGYKEQTFVLIDIFEMPLDFVEGNYIVEYTIKNNNLETKRMERVPLNCIRQLFVENFGLVEIVNEEVKLRTENNYQTGGEILLRFDLAGFQEDIPADIDQFQIEYVLLNSEGKSVRSFKSDSKGGVALSRNDVLEMKGVLILPEDVAKGKYTLLLKVNDLIHDNIIRSKNYIEVT